jgi:K+-sensing histidine kinase KdpD
MLQIKEDATSPQALWLRRKVEESVAHLQVRSSRSRRCASRGSVRIFVSGGNKQSALSVMLETAYEAQFRGADVTVGFVAPTWPSLLTESVRESARKIDYLLRGFDRLAPLSGHAVGRVRGWFDATAALTRAPNIVLIDALVAGIGALHSDPSGEIEIWRRGEEQDVMELLLAGINVWVAVDVASIGNA